MSLDQHTPRIHPLARSVRCSALALSLSALAPLSAWAQVYDIPAGDLGNALSQFAASSGVMLSFSAGDTVGLSSSGLRGDFELQQGFAQLLRGSGLQVRRAGENRYVLVRAEAGQAVELGATNVDARGLGANTEGTGSYTTGTMQSATKLALSMRETPQSVSVITRQQMDDANLTTIQDAIGKTPRPDNAKDRTGALLFLCPRLPD